jgi:deoxyribonuclease V
MAPRVDLYLVLRRLMEQIPDDMVSTPEHLAAALGDTVATRSVGEALNRGELRGLSDKVVARPSPKDGVFSDFETDHPLSVLAEFQEAMARRVIIEDVFCDLDKVAGADAVYRGDEAFAACVVLDRDLGVVEVGSAVVGTRFPYIPGYLMFREAEAVEAAVKEASGFDVLMINGHGVAHPRGCGLATCVGIELDVPTIGVAKKPLLGKIGEQRGSWAPLVFEGRVVGAEIRRRGSHAPIYVSVGHMISLQSSVETALRTLSNGLLPEPLVRAHNEARRAVKRKVMT